ncbi:MAG: hypothetical protein MI976_13990 [Pseudomonadales bacterium]|nr:hypothetical protein [Pseudomonadales bacterium]
MIRKALNCMLVILIVLQSVVALADIHQYHQEADSHVSFDDHAHEDIRPSNHAKDITDPQSDCHHCCHCHGGANPFLSKIQQDLNVDGHITTCPDYLFSKNTYLDSPDNPPPIG